MVSDIFQRNITILSIEDDEVEFTLFQKQMIKFGITNPILRASDGHGALDMLKGGVSIRPYIILLDLSMPGMDGFAFLEAVRNDKQLSSSIIFALSSLQDEDIVRRAYSYNIAGYLVKPYDSGDAEGVATLLRQYIKSVTIIP